MGRTCLQGRKASAFLLLVFVLFILCILPNDFFNEEERGRGNCPEAGRDFPIQEDFLEQSYALRLPVPLPENKTSDELVLTRAKDRSLLIKNEFLIRLPILCRILLACLMFWQRSFRKFMHRSKGCTSVLSLRIGGHAPPACIVAG